MWDRDIASVACRTNSSASREHRAIRDHACRSVQCHTSREQSAQDCRFQRGWKESGDRPGSAVADPPVPSGVRGSNRGEATVGLVWLVAESVLLEQQALREPRQTIAMRCCLAPSQSESGGALWCWRGRANEDYSSRRKQLPPSWNWACIATGRCSGVVHPPPRQLHRVSRFRRVHD